ncbi:hypothetical protein ACJIZ3_015567 [Penstemon smallii]|uniref:Uncharacterized protein n=1 Tax=Penstemon smallii TaxID=265156 RepID=A0ABD3RMW2_9LAMI
MVAENNFTRVDTRELKGLIYRKIGHQRAEEYFNQLKRFLGFKLNKADFDKSCIRTIGRENLPLHNRLIRSIIHNACQAKTPPQKVDKLNVKAANGYQKNCLQSLYGDSFPQSPRKCRSPVNRDRKFRDRPSPLGPLGKSPSITFEETVSRIHEQQSATELHSLCSRPPNVEDGEEVEQFSIIRRWASVTAPLGVSMNTDSSRKDPHCGFIERSFSETCQSSGELPDTRSLMSRLQKKLDSEGLGISMDCANLLNNSLDVYLKRIIEPCISIAAGSRCLDPCVPGGQLNNNQMVSGLNNRMLPGRFAQRQMQPKCANNLDFRVAMESNPRILGEDWPIQLEKICHNMP